MVQKGHVKRPKGKIYYAHGKASPLPDDLDLGNNACYWNCCTALFTSWSDNEWLTICETPSREVAIAHSGPSMFSIYAQWRSMPPIQGGAEFSGSTKNQHAGVA